MTKFDALKKDYSQAVRRLGEVLAMKKTKVIRDSAILRFELCFDLAWKTIKIYLEDEKGVKCFSPKVCWKEAFQNGLIEFDDLWLVMTDWRNDAVHTYNEKLADRLYGDLPKALEKFKELQKALKIQEDKKMKNISFQKGSVGLVVLVIVLSVVILGGAVGGAWYYTKIQNDPEQIALQSYGAGNTKSKVGETSVIPTEAEESLSGETATDTTTTDPTADWKTYTNDEYGFSFKYPEGWEIKGNIASGGLVLENSAGCYRWSTDPDDTNPSCIAGVAVFFQNNPNNHPNALSLLKEEQYDGLDFENNYMNFQDVVIGDNNFFNFTSISMEGGEYGQEYWVMKDNGFLAFREDLPENDKTIFDQILSTLEFTE